MVPAFKARAQWVYPAVHHLQIHIPPHHDPGDDKSVQVRSQEAHALVRQRSAKPDLVQEPHHAHQKARAPS